MTSWIVAIEKNHPEHWQIAAQHGFWDMTKNIKIGLGDVVYFWQSQKSLVSQTVVTSPAEPLTADDRLPWEDSGARTYTHRFTFRVMSENARRQPTWSQLQSATGITASPHFGPNRVASVTGETWLAEVFSTTVEPDLFMNADLRIGIDMLIGEDRRERAMREIALRRGQPAFRSALLHAYKKTCAVTGFNTERVLEAAHISPYLGLHTNRVTNGLLLRADIHTLFDLSLLTVTRDYRVHVAPELANTPYSQLNLRQLVVIPGSGFAPDPGLLADHNSNCEWLAQRRVAP